VDPHIRCRYGSMISWRQTLSRPRLRSMCPSRTRSCLRVMLLVLLAEAVACGSTASRSTEWADDFSDPASGWVVESDASAKVGYEDGSLRVDISAPSRLAWASAGRSVADFRLVVEASQVSGPDDNEYGVLARMQDADHFYRFSISGDGYFLVSRHDGDEWERLSGDWAPSEAVKQGVATNVIEVVCSSSDLSFAVNGTRLATVHDSTYQRGDIGLYAGSFFEPGVEIHFDNLQVTAPEPQ
jgi:hypothetical protein